jgi:hypothetical protein
MAVLGDMCDCTEASGTDRFCRVIGGGMGIVWDDAEEIPRGASGFAFGKIGSSMGREMT